MTKKRSSSLDPAVGGGGVGPTLHHQRRDRDSAGRYRTNKSVPEKCFRRVAALLSSYLVLSATTAALCSSSAVATFTEQRSHIDSSIGLLAQLNNGNDGRFLLRGGTDKSRGLVGGIWVGGEVEPAYVGSTVHQQEPAGSVVAPQVSRSSFEALVRPATASEEVGGFVMRSSAGGGENRPVEEEMQLTKPREEGQDFSAFFSAFRAGTHHLDDEEEPLASPQKISEEVVDRRTVARKYEQTLNDMIAAEASVSGGGRIPAGESVEEFNNLYSSLTITRGQHDVAIVTNVGRRKNMEDVLSIRVVKGDPAGRDPDGVIFGVFDGHGNDAASLMTARYLPLRLEALMKSGSTTPEGVTSSPDAMMKKAFSDANDLYKGFEKATVDKENTDEEFPLSTTSERRQGGTTALVAYLKGNELTLAHVGDSRAVRVKTSGEVEELTEDHSPSLQSEADRVRNAYLDFLRGESKDGEVVKLTPRTDAIMNGRVHGELAMTRAIGDFRLTGVIAEPEVRSLSIGPDDSYIVLASDGLWSSRDSIRIKEVLKSATVMQSPKSVADELTSLSEASGDNLGIIVIDVRPRVGTTL